tara:strand:- start:356 stop:739 length:384 start_codon:yes stop_codon:yes gene_type:complete
MFSFFGLGSNSKTSSSLTTKGRKMARTQQYVIYTREFRTRAKQIGVFAEPVSGYTVNGAVHGGKIKFKNLAVKNTKRKTATNKLLSKGIDFTVNVLGTASKSSALGMKSNLISLLKKSGRKVINYSA